MKLSDFKTRFFAMIYLVPSLAISIVFCVSLIARLRPFLPDYYVYWTESRMILHHVNPLEDGFGYFPWSLVLMLMFTIPQLPYYASSIIFFLLMLIYIFLFLVLTINVIKKHGFNIPEICITLIVLSSVPLLESIAYGNIGSFACISSFVSLYLAYENRILLSGIFAALSLIKPHATGLMIFPFIACGYFNIIVISLAILGLSTFILSAWINENPITMMSMLFSNGTRKMAHQSSGIFTFLINFNVNENIVFYLSIAVALLYAFILLFYLRKNGICSIFNLSIPFCISLSFWFYENMQDEYILFLPLLVYMMILFENNDLFKCRISKYIPIILFSFGAIAISMSIENIFSINDIYIYRIIVSFLHSLVALFGIKICTFITKFRPFEAELDL